MKAASAIDKISEKLTGGEITVVREQRESFEEFLLKDARVPIGQGYYGPYTFEGREAMLGVVRTVDRLLGSKTGTPIQDSKLVLAGGAQFGKTILELNLGAFITSQLYYNFGLYLPDDKLAETVIDTKFRPDVVDQIPWLARMTQIGKATNSSGKQVNSKRAATITDGKRRANFLVSGLQKPATTITLDVAARDEEDDIPPKNAKYVKGRMTASKLRIEFVIGTQRIHGRGQEKAWKDGSQGVTLLGPASDHKVRADFPASESVGVVPPGWLTPEEVFPQVVRCAVAGTPRTDDPQLTWSGDFRHPSDNTKTVAVHKPGQVYYLAHPETGEVLDRAHPLWHHRKPGQIEMNEVSMRISQLAIGAISMGQIVGRFQLAVKDPDEMIVFRCDVLALPRSTAQALTPSIIERAQTVEPFEMRFDSVAGRPKFGGMDVGDLCYFLARERESVARKRLTYAATFPSGDMVRRAESLFHQLNLTTLFIDQRPEASSARSIALALNGLNALERNMWPQDPAEQKWISLPGGLTWDGKHWRNLKCAVVRFDKKSIGAGIEHGFDLFEQDGVKKFVPLIRCNRMETIDRAVREFLTPAEGVVEVAGGRVREEPAMLLPRRGSNKVLEELEAHLVTGSERVKEKDGTLGDYVDQCANHFLLADGYSALAENECATEKTGSACLPPRAFGQNQKGRAMASRKDRSVIG